jgi:hypothetical protein
MRPSSRKRSGHAANLTPVPDQDADTAPMATPQKKRWDTSNVKNWNASTLRAELCKKGIKVPTSLSRKVLLDLFKENKDTVIPADARDVDCVMPMDTHVAQCEQVGSPAHNVYRVPGPAANHTDSRIGLVSTGSAGSDSLPTTSTLSQGPVATCASLQQQQLQEAALNLHTATNLRAQHTHPVADNMAAPIESVESDRLSVLESHMTTIQATLNKLAGAPTATPASLFTQSSAAADYRGFTLQDVMAGQSAAQPIGLTCTFPNQQRGAFGVPADSVPQQVVIQPSLRKAIIEGKDINLGTLFIRNYEYGEVKSVELGDTTVRLKQTDKRLQETLDFKEFSAAFSIYQRVMCEAFPARREELDLYFQHIVKMSVDFPGRLFYEYHRQFSAQAAAQLRVGIKIDWSVPHVGLLARVTGGHKVSACDICGNMSHTTKFCPSSMDAPRSNARPWQTQTRRDRDPPSRPRYQYYKGREICNNYNGPRGCTREFCHYEHVCLQCSGTHTASSCGQSSRQASQRANTANTNVDIPPAKGRINPPQ